MTGTSETSMTLVAQDTDLLEAPQENAPNVFAQVHRLLRGRYWLAILLGLAGAAAGGYFGYRLPQPQYESTGLIRIKPSLPRILYKNDQNDVMPMFDSYMESQVTLIQSQRVIDLAMQNAEWKALNRGLMPDEVFSFSKSVTAAHPPGSELVMVTFADLDPEAARRGVAAVIDAYDRLYGENDSESAQSRMKLLDERRQTLVADYKRLGDQARALVGLSTASSLEQLYDAKLRRMLKLEAQLQEAELAIALNSGTATTRPAREGPASLETLAMRVPEIARMLGMRRDMERELAIDRKQFGENHRSIKDQEVRIEALTQQLDELVSFYQKLSTESSGETLLAAAATPSLEQLKQNQASVRKAYDRAKVEAEEMGKKCYDLEQMRAKLEETKSKLDETNQRIDQLNTESGMGGRISIESRGDRPLGPTKDRRRSIAATSAAGAGGLGVALIAVLGLFDRRIKHISDVKQPRDRRNILGVLPLLPSEAAGAEDAMVAAHGVHQIRMLLQQRFTPGRTPVVTITSSTPGAGKTSLTLALGLSFAASGSRTLVMDCDIIGGGLTSKMKSGSRRRVGHILRRLGLISTEQLVAALKESKKRGERTGQTLVRRGQVTEADVAHALEVQRDALVGLREALNGDGINECITGAGVNNLFLMPLGSARRQHVGHLSSAALLRVLEQARPWFDVILIDTGPILGSLEASMAVMAADEVVLTVARGEQRPLVDRAIEQVQRMGGRLAGLVLNRVSVGEIISSGASSSTSRMSGGSGAAPPVGTIVEIDHHSLRLGPISNAVVALSDFPEESKPTGGEAA